MLVQYCVNTILVELSYLLRRVSDGPLEQIAWVRGVGN